MHTDKRGQHYSSSRKIGAALEAGHFDSSEATDKSHPVLKTHLRLNHSKTPLRSWNADFRSSRELERLE